MPKSRNRTITKQQKKRKRERTKAREVAKMLAYRDILAEYVRRETARRAAEAEPPSVTPNRAGGCTITTIPEQADEVSVLNGD